MTRTPGDTTNFNEGKFREMILYVCARSMDDPNFDTEKLKWILWHVDTAQFVKYGKSITGGTYEKRV